MPTTISGSTGLNLIGSGNQVTFSDSSIQNTSPKTGFVNRIINGEMDIDQRNAGASGTAVGYTVDRWAYFGSQTSKGTWQQNAGAVTPPVGYVNYLGFTSSSAYSVLATDQFLLSQKIEGSNVSDLGWGTANAQPVTVSFWVRSSLAGTFGGALQNSAANRNYPFAYTISSANTWEYKLITVAGDTTGTWLTNNGTGIGVVFNLGTGTTYSGTAGAWSGTSFITAPTGATSVVGTNGATFYITGVQLEKGSTATPFEFRSIGQELALCQRYYQTYSNPPLRGVYASTVAASRCGMILPVVMRATPTATVGTVDFFDGNAVSTASSISVAYLNAKSVEFDFTVASAVMGAFRPAVVYQSGSTNNLFLTAEL